MIQIKYYRRGGFRKTKVGGNQLLHDREIERVLSGYFEFESHHYDTVDHLLQLMGIANTSDFDVIHWRAELPNIRFNDCADKILQAKHAMNNSTIVLMSSINGKAGMQWYKLRNQSVASGNSARQ